ncbi:MAG: hypothetical protein LRS49_03450 [Desulfurococcales archaeon]|nr:hypothetical protein [Desulfurococcales archaeon]
MTRSLADRVRRLSYADRRWLALYIVGLAVSAALGYWVYGDTRANIEALGQGYVSDEIYYVDVARRLLIDVFNVGGREWYEWSGKTGQDYYNPEHPPLGKYIIGASMLACGDKPECWRLPGAVEAGLVPVILYIGYATPRRGGWGVLAGLAAALAASSSASLRAEGAVAMLDIHQAFFSTIAVAALAAERLELSVIAVGLAGSVKYSGFFLIPALWFYAPRYCKGCRLSQRLRVFLATTIIPPLVTLSLSVPIILHFGLKWFWENSVVGALGWHTTSRPPGPPTSSPLGWMFNVNPFYFDYNTMLGGLANPILYITAIAIGAAVIVYSASRDAWPASGSASFYSSLGLYLLLYNLGALHIPGLHGNKTLYSFYLVQLAPLAAATFGDAVSVRAEQP